MHTFTYTIKEFCMIQKIIESVQQFSQIFFDGIKKLNARRNSKVDFKNISGN